MKKIGLLPKLIIGIIIGIIIGKGKVLFVVKFKLNGLYASLLNVGYIAACVRDDYPYQRKQLYLTKPSWEPVFEPDSTTLGLIGDGAAKINVAVPGYFDKNNIRKLTGIDPSL